MQKYHFLGYNMKIITIAMYRHWAGIVVIAHE